MSRWDTVCFDLDGTLVDTLEDLAHATEEVLMRNRLGRMDGKPVYPLDAYRQFVGSGARKLIERAAGEFVGKELVDHLLQEFLAVYDRDCLMYSHPYEEIPALLGSLQDRGLVERTSIRPAVYRLLSGYGVGAPEKICKAAGKRTADQGSDGPYDADPAGYGDPEPGI